jgi:cob(I)alamin adenosyltransferase
MTTVQMREVRVAYGDTEALHGVSARVERGQWLALVGPNGSGKTSALRAVSGLVPFGGEILIGERPTRSLGKRALGREIAFVPQHPVAPQGMRVSTYALLGRTPHIPYFSQESEGDRAMAHRVCSRLGVGHLLDREVTSLSGGERQLVVLARSLAQEPSVLLLDEPTSALDIGHQQEVLEMIDDLRCRDGIAVISAMHDLTQAGQYADTVSLLSGGQIVVSGSAASVLTKEHIEEHYRATVAVSGLPSGGVSIVPTRRPRPRLAAVSGSEGESAGREPGRATPPTEPPVRKRQARASSLFLVNTGDGKGKSTAAFGVVIRAVARGWRVCVVQFIKSGEWRAGEEAVCRGLGVDWWTIGDGFTWESEDLDRSEAIARAAWAAASEKIASAQYDLVVLDEITYPMNWGWIPSEEVLGAVRDRPPKVNIVATGRDAPEELLELADTATEMRKLRHAYDRGVGARRGIDF